MKIQILGEAAIELTELGSAELEIVTADEEHGFGPLQMFAASMGLCTAAVLTGYDDEVLKVGHEGLRLSLRWQFAERPHRVSAVELEIEWPGLPDNRMAAVRRAAATCTIHRTLERPPTITTEVRTSVTPREHHHAHTHTHG